MTLQAKKSLGQNFLRDEAVLARIAESAQLTAADTVLEIGPGTGALTEHLSRHAGRVIACEVDRDLIPKLLKQFPLSSNVTILEKDILHADMASVLGAAFRSGGYVIAANIPYYITAPILRFIMELPAAPSRSILMMQKEVAERITAAPGAMSILAVSVRYYADPEYLFDVPRNAFEPVPKVDSAVVRITPKRAFDRERDRVFFRIVKIGFSSRRKTLVNTLSAGLQLSKETISKSLESSRISSAARAQELSVADWERLVECLQES